MKHKTMEVLMSLALAAMAAATPDQPHPRPPLVPGSFRVLVAR